MKKRYIKIIVGLAVLVLGGVSFIFWTNALYEFGLFGKVTETPAKSEFQSAWPTLSRALYVSQIDILDRLQAEGVDVGQLVMQVLCRFWFGVYLSELAMTFGLWLMLKHNPESRTASRILAVLRWCAAGIALLATAKFVWLFFGGGTRVLSP